LRKVLLIRFLLSLLAGMVLAIPIDEIAFRLQGRTTSRPPKTVELDIPAGAAAKVGAGQIVLPQDLVVVAGDVLVVHNYDSVVHSLGPLVIPPGSTASLALTQVGNLSFECSFQPTKYLGLTIQEPLTFGVRLEGIIIAGVPVGMLIAVYSLIVRPLKPKQTPINPS
jgi:hypothetical protein